VSLSLTSPFDNSVVTVTLPGQTPQTFTLNRGQTYLYRDFAGTLDGTTVVSSFPVGVIVSSDNTSGNSFSATQLIPEPLLGNQFAIPAPPAFLDGYLKACAVRDNTTITVDGVTQTTLNRGEVYSAFHTSGLFLEGSQNLVVLSYLVEVEGSAASTELVPAVDEGVDFVRLNTSGPGRVDSVQVVVPANERTLLRAGGQPVPESRFTLFGNGAYAQANFLLGNPINLNTSGASGLAARVVGEGPGGPTLTTSSARFRDFFTVTQLDSPVYGQPVRFRVSAPANFDPLFRFICYRPVGTLPYVIDNLVLQNGEYFGTIPGQYINEKGVEFHISFSDGTVLRTSPGVNAERDPAVISVPLANFQPPSLDIEAAVYKMISIPYPLDSPSVNSVIEDDYGPYDPAVWRVFRYLPSLGDYRELPDLVEGAEDFRRGRAFWLVANLDNIFDVDGTRTLSAVDSARVTLESGWNQLGNPFAFQVRWDSIPGADALQGPYYYDGVEYVIDNRLRPWEGVFVFNPGAAFDLVIPPYDALQGLGKSPQNGVDEVAWALRLQASIAGTRYRDTQTRLGWVEDGQPDPATLALREPPPVSSNLQVMILEEETSYLQYFKSFAEAGIRWRLRVASPGANQTVTLQFLEEAALREGFELACYDAKTGKSLPIRQGVLQLSTGASGERFLELAVGSADFQTQTAADLQPVITRFALQPNYPNPFNPETEIRFDLPRAGEVKLSVFNLLGQEIRTLSTGNY
ncbi:MAG: T9SS type A sorting domain-containing protein, partial [Calditrichaeota bacterium]|nr:T9SS type A sorting domain-containing protein [Calditrichota bacterium]